MTGEYECNGKLDGCAQGFTFGNANPIAVNPCRALIQNTIAKTDCQGFSSIPDTDVHLCKIQLDYPSGYNFLAQGQTTCGTALRNAGIDPCDLCNSPTNGSGNGNGGCNPNATTFNLEPNPSIRFSSIGNMFSSGDFNADGNTDLSVSLNYVNINRQILVEFGPLSISKKNVTEVSADFQAIIPQNQGLIGLLKMQDINGDGIDDLIYHNTMLGGVFAYSGSSNLPSIINPLDGTSAHLIIRSSSGNINFGQSFAIGNIFSGINLPSIALGDGQNVYVFSQNTINSAFATNNRIITESDSDIIISRELEGCNFGSSVVIADVVGNNSPDLIVGDSCFNPISPLTSPGKIYTFSGPISSGFIDASSVTETIQGLVPINNEPIENIGGIRDIILGDWNADGKDDMFLLTSANPINTGVVFIFLGNTIPSGARLTSDADFVLRGNNPSDFFGIAADFTSSMGANNQPAICVGKPAASQSFGEIDCFFGGASPNSDSSNPDIRISGSDSNHVVGYEFKLDNFGQSDATDIAFSVGTLKGAGEVHVCFGPEFDCSNLC